MINQKITLTFFDEEIEEEVTIEAENLGALVWDLEVYGVDSRQSMVSVLNFAVEETNVRQYAMESQQ